MLDKIKTLSQFITYLEKLETKRVRGSSFFYRGHEEIKYVLLPSLYRSKKLVSNEYRLYKETILENPSEFGVDNTTLEKLVRMQHYGLPTRLLDITRNPIVALFFACSNQNGTINKETDGEVVVLQIPKRDIKYYDSDSVSVVSNLCKLKTLEKRFHTELDYLLFNSDNNGLGNGNIYKLLHAIREEKSYFSLSIQPCDINRIFCVQVKKNNARVIVQDGLFLIFGLGKNREPLNVYDEWLPIKKNEEKLVIDKSYKYSILKELERISISQKSLFPEIENNARLLKKKYS